MGSKWELTPFTQTLNVVALAANRSHWWMHRVSALTDGTVGADPDMGKNAKDKHDDNDWPILWRGPSRYGVRHVFAIVTFITCRCSMPLTGSENRHC